MEGFSLGWTLLIALCIFIGSHLSIDRDFSPAFKKGATVCMVLLVVVYVIFVIL